MRGAVKRISALLLSVAMAAGILYMASGCGEADTGAERYTIVYDLNYEGFVGCEYNPQGITEEGLTFLSPYLKKPA